MHQPLTQNLYLYVGGNPANYADPSGHAAKKGSISSAGSVRQKKAIIISPKSIVINKNQPPKKSPKYVIPIEDKGKSILLEMPNRMTYKTNMPQLPNKGDSILGTILDMHVKTLVILNRQFCSASTAKANTSRNKSNNVAAQMILDKAIVMGYAQNWKTAQDILAFIWMIALAEPTFWGEVIAAVITVVVVAVLIVMLAYAVYKLWIYSQSEAISIADAEAAIPGIAGGLWQSRVCGGCCGNSCISSSTRTKWTKS